jgi:hypothetical protein
MHIRVRALSACSVLLAAFFLMSSTGLFAQDKKDQKNQPKYSKDQVQEAQALVAVVDNVVAAKQPVPADIPVSFYHHFMRSREGKSFMPYTLTIDPAAVASGNILLYVRAVSKTPPPAAAAAPAVPADAKDKDKNKAQAPARPEYAWEEYYFVDLKSAPPAAGQPYRLSRYVGVPPGEYDLYFAVRERPANPEKKDKNAPPAKTAVLKQTVTAPDFNAGLATSSVIVVEKVEDLAAPLPEAQLRENPYTFGNMKLTPALLNKFTKKEEISWIFVIYNASLDATAKKPDVSVEYSFYQKTKDGEKYFNKTSPQIFSAQTLPPQWDVNVNQISAGQSVPLASFPEGDFRLEVKIVDKLGNKTITENVPFTVVAGS